MAGGFWSQQDKVLPGVYLNYKSEGANPQPASSRGIVGLAVSLPWCADHEVINLTGGAAASLAALIGKTAALPITEAAKNASLIRLYRLNKGAAATATMGNLVCTAAHTGATGNRISVSIENTVGQSGKYDVVTWLDAAEYDRQTAGSVSGLKDNDLVKFTKSASADTLAVNAGTNLEGGTDGTTTTADHTAFLAAMELQAVNAIACVSNDADVKALYVAWTKRQQQEEGVDVCAVLPDIAGADHETVISVKNGVYLEDGTHIPKEIAAAYIAGATAGSALTDSLTNAAYDGAARPDTLYTKAEQIDFVRGGQMVFIPAPGDTGGAVIQKDINTLVTYTQNKTYLLSKNKIVRLLFDAREKIRLKGQKYYSGKIDNSVSGRELLQKDILADFRAYEQQGLLHDVVPEDIVVRQGDLPDAVVVDFTMRGVDKMEIIYGSMTITA